MGGDYPAQSAAATLAAVRRELRHVEPPKAQCPAARHGSNAQAKGLASARDTGVPHWREARPERVHRRGKRSPRIAAAANLSGKADSEGIPGAAQAAPVRRCPRNRPPRSRRCPPPPAARPRCTPCTSNSAPRWCPSPATTCRSATRPASSPSTGTAATSAALFDVSHMGQLRLVGDDAARGARVAGAGRRDRPGPASSATRFFTNAAAASSTT